MKPVLVLNAGSSSLKFAVAGEGGQMLARGQAAGIGGDGELVAEMAGKPRQRQPLAGLTPEAAQAAVFGWLAAAGFSDFAGAGHRLVHGGSQFTAPVLVDDGVFAALQPLARLAPLHMPFGLEALKAARARLAGVPQVACFDTAFHAGQHESVTRFALPDEYWAKGYRRYGFHGLNYQHVAEAIAPAPSRTIIAHLGSGASLCGLKDGKSIATTMGYSTLDGLVMGTRPGSLDPGLLLALMQDEGLGPRELEKLLYKQSGLLGLSGLSNDMKVLLESDAPRAKLAVEIYCQSVARHAASLAVLLGGLDLLVFTAGVGENAAAVREKVTALLAFLPKFATRVVPADEEGLIARQVREIVG